MTEPLNEAERDRNPLSRRSYLRLTGALAIGSVPAKSTHTTYEYRGIEFEDAVDLVEDYGADPTGEEPVDDEIRAAAAADRVVEVPDGDYLFSDGVVLRPPEGLTEAYQFSLLGPGNLGFRAKPGATPRFVPPDGHNSTLLTINNAPRVLFDGIDVDIRAPDTTAGLKFGTDYGFQIRNVEFLGRGTHPEAALPNALTLTVKESSGLGIVRNVVAEKGSAIGHYKAGNGRIGAFVGKTTSGTVRFEHCRFEEFGNNGLYVSRTPGNVEVIGGVYRNNNVAGVRIAGDGSFVKDATVVVELDRYTGPTTRLDTAYSTRGIVIDAGDIHQTPGALVKDCKVIFSKSDPTSGAVSVQNWDETVEQELFVEDTVIEVNDDVAALYSEGGPVHVRYSSIAGSADGGQAVQLDGALASKSTILGTCIDQTGSHRGGIRARVADCAVEYTNIDVTDEALVEQNGGVITTSHVTREESCASSPAMAERRRHHLFTRLLRRVGIQDLAS